MAEPAQPETSPVAASFAEHVRAFHRSLPPEEQALLEQVFALAEAAGESAEVTGFRQAIIWPGITKSSGEPSKPTYPSPIQTKIR